MVQSFDLHTLSDQLIHSNGNGFAHQKKIYLRLKAQFNVEINLFSLLLVPNHSIDGDTNDVIHSSLKTHHDDSYRKINGKTENVNTFQWNSTEKFIVVAFVYKKKLCSLLRVLVQLVKCMKKEGKKCSFTSNTRKIIVFS